MSVIRVNVILFGIGNVGSTLIQQILESQQFFLEQRNIDLRVPIITNSTVAFYEKEGVRNQYTAPKSLDKFKLNFDNNEFDILSGSFCLD